MQPVRARATFSYTGDHGEPVVVYEGEIFYEDDQVVRRFPGSFEPVRPRVEQASAAPGEFRNVRRPRA